MLALIVFALHLVEKIGRATCHHLTGLYTTGVRSHESSHLTTLCYSSTLLLKGLMNLDALLPSRVLPQLLGEICQLLLKFQLTDSCCNRSTVRRSNLLCWSLPFIDLLLIKLRLSRIKFLGLVLLPRRPRLSSFTSFRFELAPAGSSLQSGLALHLRVRLVLDGGRRGRSLQNS